MKKTFLLKLLFLPLLFALLASQGKGRVSAAASDPVNECQPYDASWKLNVWKSIDLQNTTENLSNAAGNMVFAKVFGADTNAVVKCEGSLATIIPTGTRVTSCGHLGGSITVCGEDGDEVDNAACQTLMNNSQTITGYNNKSTELLSINTSLIGISNRIQDSVYRDPIAVNFAYYWKSQVAKIPFVGKTYAAATVGQPSMAIINAVLSIWVACRNISLGFIAVILMYTGLLIIMRKKVNQQLVVTVQYAIPKIIIGLILILFSYPIGAAITGLSWGLFRSAPQIVVNTLYGTGVNATIFANQVLLALVIGALKMGFFAGLGFFLVIIVAVITLILGIIVNIKALVIYLKMVFSVVTAPFEFALGTVPGSEDKIKDWFLRMAKYGLTIFAMGLIIPATMAVALEVLMYYSCSCVTAGSCAVETAGMGTFMMFAAPLVIVILGLSMAMKMEDSVDKMLFGGGKGKGKK